MAYSSREYKRVTGIVLAESLCLYSSSVVDYQRKWAPNAPDFWDSQHWNRKKNLKCEASWNFKLQGPFETNRLWISPSVDSLSLLFIRFSQSPSLFEFRMMKREPRRILMTSYSFISSSKIIIKRRANAWTSFLFQCWLYWKIYLHMQIFRLKNSDSPNYFRTARVLFIFQPKIVLENTKYERLNKCSNEIAKSLAEKSHFCIATFAHCFFLALHAFLNTSNDNLFTYFV